MVNRGQVTGETRSLGVDPEDEEVIARFFPKGYRSEMALTADGSVFLFKEGRDVEISQDTCDEIADVIDFIQELTDESDREDKTIANLSAFTGLFRLLATLSNNSYVSPPERSRSDYGEE